MYQLIPLVFWPFTPLITVSDRLDTFSSLQYLYFARFFDLYEHYLTPIITSQLHQFEFPLASFCAWGQHLCAQQASVDSGQCQRNRQNKDTANYCKCLDGPTMCALTLPHHHQIIKAGVRVRGVYKDEYKAQASLTLYQTYHHRRQSRSCLLLLRTFHPRFSLFHDRICGIVSPCLLLWLQQFSLSSSRLGRWQVLHTGQQRHIPSTKVYM